MPDPTVQVTTSGRGGSIYYREEDRTATFDWEFAASPAIALILGPGRDKWDLAYPWAAGRQAEIYEFVAGEVARQRAPGSGFEIDLDAGIIELIHPVRSAGSRYPGGETVRRAPRTPSAFDRLAEGVTSIESPGAEGQRYDLSLLPGLTEAQKEELVTLITRRGVTWREVELLAAIDTAPARAAVDAASHDHLSIDTRLAAGEVMHRQGRLPDLAGFLAREIRELYLPSSGLERALRLAARVPAEPVRQALLWASYNRTECAPRCAALLLELVGAGREPFEEPLRELLRKLGPHNSAFDRAAAFQELCRVVAMEFDPGAAGV